MSKTNFILFLFILCLSGLSASDLKLQMAAETGLYNSNQINDQLIFRFIGRAAYLQKFTDHYFSLRSRFAPEFYGTQNDASTIKFSNNFVLGTKKSPIPWQAHLRTKHYFYNLPASSGLSFTIFLLGASIDHRIHNKIILRLSADYFYRDTARQPSVNMDGLTVSPSCMYILNRTTQLSANLSIERFIIEQRHQNETGNKNYGWRLGPKLSIHHRSAFLFNAFYRLIGHHSQAFDINRIEHELQVVWGRFIKQRLSIFFYLHYLKRQESNLDLPVSLAYTPAENENWYYLKIGLDTSERFEIYTKAGYVRDDLIFSKKTISGWQTLFGFNFKL